MKHFILISFCFMAVKLSAQNVVVFDPVVTSTLVGNHIMQQEKLKDIKSESTKILGIQTIISVKVNELKEIEQKMHNRLKDVKAIIKQSNDIKEAYKIVKDIEKYQKEMIVYATDDPKLLIVAYETEKALIEKSVNLLVYLSNAIVGGDVNLLDNKQRQDIILHVVEELRIMRGMAYGVARKMKLASRVGLWKSLNAFKKPFPDEDIKIANKIIKHF